MPTIRPLSTRRIVSTWWPLATSWLLMGAELPAVSAIIARLANPEVHLAAYGGIVSPLALIIESPILMLLAASTALSKDWASYRKLYRFMMSAGLALTLLHVSLAFTPLYDLIVVRVLAVPAEVVEPARIGLMIMTPWTWSIAYRRFHQGILIRFGHTRAIGIGTVIRLATDVTVLLVGYALRWPGIVAGSSAVAAGVVMEAVYVAIVVRPVLRSEVRFAPEVTTPVTLRSFLAFYIPLAMTSLLSLLVQPMGSAAISRMPLALESLAAWPVASGLLFMIRSLGISFNEVVVALLDEPNSTRSLRRFTAGLTAVSLALLLVVVATPLSTVWFKQVSALDNELASLAQAALWIALPIPAMSVLQSWFQGSILQGQHTRGITEAVIIYLVFSVATLAAGVRWGGVPGILIGMASFAICTAIQTAWLWYRSRPALASVEARDRAIMFNLPEPGTANTCSVVDISEQ